VVTPSCRARWGREGALGDQSGGMTWCRRSAQPSPRPLAAAVRRDRPQRSCRHRPGHGPPPSVRRPVRASVPGCASLLKGVADACGSRRSRCGRRSRSALPGCLCILFGRLQAVMIADTVQSILLIVGGLAVFFIAGSQVDSLGAAFGTAEAEIGDDAMAIIQPAGDDFLPWPGRLLGVFIVGFHHFVMVLPGILTLNSGPRRPGPRLPDDRLRLALGDPARGREPANGSARPGGRRPLHLDHRGVQAGVARPRGNALLSERPSAVGSVARSDRRVRGAVI
jgi:hypothetical protein